MKLRGLPIVLLVALRGLDGDHGIAFAPRAGSVVVKTFDTTLELRLERKSLWWEGTRGPFRWDVPVSMRLRETQQVVFTDRCLGAEGERITKLRRRFDALTLEHESEVSSSDGRDQGHDTERGKGRLVDRSVQFTWDAERTDFFVEAADGTYIDRDERRELVAESDFVELLPLRRVAIGDGWRAGGDVLREVFEPGGAYEFVESDRRVLRRTLDPALVRGLAGTLRCELVELRSLDGHDVAVIELRGDVETKLRENEDVLEIPMFMIGIARVSGWVESELKLSVEGSISWDLDAARLLAANLRATVTLSRETRGRTSYADSEAGVSESWRGEFECEAAFAAAGESTE